jgi:gluconolactonase
MRTMIRQNLIAPVICAAMMLPFAEAEEPMMPPTVAEAATLEEIHSGGAMFEGPTWDPVTQSLYFTACRAGQILRFSGDGPATVWMENTGGVNGMCLSRNGRLLGAQVFGHRVVSIALGAQGPGDIQVLASDERWNQPNDVCETPSGDIYFSDPDFAHHATSAVYHLAPDGAVTRAITDMPLPNGLIASLDGATLYVGDSHLKHWRAYPILPDGNLGEGRVFFDPSTENPDGMTIDEHGNLHFAGRGGVWVVSPDGEALGLIRTPVFCSNVGFGGPDGRTLFLTCRGKVFRLPMRVHGG